MVIILRHDLKRIARGIAKLIEDCDNVENEIEREENVAEENVAEDN